MSNEKMVPWLDGENNRFGTPYQNHDEILFLESLDKEERKKVEEAMQKQMPEAYEDFLKWVEEWEKCDRDFDLWYEKKLEEIYEL